MLKRVETNKDPETLQKIKDDLEILSNSPLFNRMLLLLDNRLRTKRMDRRTALLNQETERAYLLEGEIISLEYAVDILKARFLSGTSDESLTREPSY